MRNMPRSNRSPWTSSTSTGSRPGRPRSTTAALPRISQADGHLPAATARTVGDRLWHATLDSLPDRLVVLDEDGEIVAVNAAWSSFAEAHGAATTACVGVNYLEVCDAAAQEPEAAEAARGLRAVVAGELADFECVYPCPAPEHEQWFSMRVVAVEERCRRQLVVTHQDVTTRCAAQRRSLELGALLDVVDAAVVATDLTGVITHWSDAAQALYGWSAAEAVGCRITTVIVGPAERPAAEAVMRAIRDKGHWSGDFTVSRKDGTQFPAHLRHRLLRGEEGVPTGVVGVAVDVSDRVAMEQQLRGARDVLATVTHTMPDGLVVLDAGGRVTLANRAAVALLGWSEAELRGQVLSDRVHALRADGSVRPATERPFFQDVASNVTRRVEDDVFQRRDGSLLPVEYSAAPFAADGGEPGCLVLFTDISEHKASALRVRRELDALSWVGRIRDALAEDRFVLYAQPIIEIATGRTVQHELLLRMRGTNGEIVSPAAFLPVAERHGLIGAVDRRVFELAMGYAAAGHPVEVNISADSISDPGLFEFVQAQLVTHDVDPRLIVFEITETALIQNEGVAQAFIEDVRRLDCAVALDDFGTGYGSFRYLKRLPVSLLKIDQEFIRDLDGADSEVNRHVIQAIVTLGRGMGQKTVAEGVETATALQHLIELGVDYAQGYYFARPAPADDVFAAIEQEATG